MVDAQNGLELHELSDSELETVTGGSQDSQIVQTLANAVSDVMKNFGGALQAVARG